MATGGKALRACDLAPAMADRAFCHSQVGEGSGEGGGGVERGFPWQLVLVQAAAVGERDALGCTNCGYITLVRASTHTQDGQHHNVIERDDVCEAQKTSIAHLRSQSLFRQLNCTLATGHYDFG